MMDGLVQDMRYALRIFRGSRGFSATAVTMLAVGIGANAAIFSVVNALLWRPLPAADPETLAALLRGDEQAWSYGEYVDFRDGTRMFSGLAAHTAEELTLNIDGHGEIVFGHVVTGNFFDVIGIAASRGRMLLADDDTASAQAAAVLSFNFWKRGFGATPDAVGRSIILNGYRFTIVGIAPEGFIGAIPPFSADVWVPYAMWARLRYLQSSEVAAWRANRRRVYGMILGRLARGITRAQAEEALNALDTRLMQAYPDTNQRLRLGPIRVAPVRGMYFIPEGRRFAAAIGGILLAAVGCVLLVACANVANLLLARAAARRPEIGVRLALGASPRRVFRQLLTESAILALLGVAAGLLVAVWLTDLLLALRPRLPWPIAIEPDTTLDWRVVGFSLGLGAVATIAFGLAPSLQASKLDLVRLLRDRSADGWASRRFGLRGPIVVAQVAISLVLLVTTGLFIRSLQSARALEPRFETRDALVLWLHLRLQGYTEETGPRFYGELSRRLSAVPGVSAVGLASFLPLEINEHPRTRISVAGREPAPREPPLAVRSVVVDSEFFRAMGIPLVRGRPFSRTRPEDIVIVNETMAQRLWPGQEAIGKRIRIETATGPVESELVGVARDSTYERLGESPVSVMYLPFARHYVPRMHVIVRTGGNSAAVAARIRREVQALDQTVPVMGMRTLREHLELSLGLPRMFATVVALFGAVALLLTAVGLSGLVSYLVAQRTREIGLRMALGAQSTDVLALLLRQIGMLTLVGAGLGLAGALLATRFLKGFLHWTSSTDPIAFAGMSSLLVLTALLSTYLPARRAAQIDPMTALRQE